MGGARAIALGVLTGGAATFGLYKLARYTIFGRWEWVRVGTVKSLHVYPIKSCMGCETQELSIDSYGAVSDRRFVVVDERNRFVTQRQEAEMCLIKATVLPTGQLCLEAPGMTTLRITPITEEGPGGQLTIGIWDDEVRGIDQGPAAADWLTHYLKRPLKLVGMPARTYTRPTDARYTPKGTVGHAAYSDGFPFLLATESSLIDLNSRLRTPLPMNRFRPNIVLGGVDTPWAEDTWREITIGEQKFVACKPCSRCKITTTDQSDGTRAEEPLVTLATFRSKRHLGTRAGDKTDVFFGQNLCHFGPGKVRVGDAVHARVWVW